MMGWAGDQAAGEHVEDVLARPHDFADGGSEILNLGLIYQRYARELRLSWVDPRKGRIFAVEKSHHPPIKFDNGLRADNGFDACCIVDVRAQHDPPRFQILASELQGICLHFPHIVIVLLFFVLHRCVFCVVLLILLGSARRLSVLGVDLGQLACDGWVLREDLTSQPARRGG